MNQPVNPANPTTVIFWDIDGTLLRTHTPEHMLYKAALSETFNTPLAEISNPNRYTFPRVSGKTDWQIILEHTATYLETAQQHTHSNTHPKHPHSDLLIPARNVQQNFETLSTYTYNPRFATQPQTVSRLPLTLEALNFAETHHIINALLTGNSRRRAEMKLATAGIPSHLINWELSQFGGQAETREALTRAAKETLNSETVTRQPTDGVIVGDTPNDGYAAAAAGLPFVAVTTGAYTHLELSSGKVAASAVTQTAMEAVRSIIQLS